MALVVCPINRKGGVGKSSSVYHLSGVFAQQGFRVLCIDNEPQHSLTNGFLGPQEANLLAPTETTSALFMVNDVPDANQLIKETNFGNIDLIAGSDSLDQFNGPTSQAFNSLQLRIRNFIRTVADDYDFVLIDNPPNLQTCTYASLAASNFTYCISKPQEYDVQGLVPVRKAIDEVLRTTNPSIRLAGYVLNMVQARRSLHKAYENLLRRTYEEKVFEVMIPDWNDFAESLTARKPISYYKPGSRAASVMEQFAKELFVRIRKLHMRPPEFQHLHPKQSSKRQVIQEELHDQAQTNQVS